jgi:hypothetical protein
VITMVKRKVVKPVAKEQDQEAKSINVDITKMFSYDVDNFTPDIKVSGYSNLAYIQVNQRDVFIDFMEMPGIRKDDKVMVNGIRVFMSHSAAKKLSEKLNEILDDVYQKGQMERYPDIKE